MASTLVMLHGFTHTGASWQPVIRTLGTSYRALAPDIRGHGSASGMEPVTIDAVVDDLARLEPVRFSLIGYSMGGRIALHVALALSARVERLVLIGASPGIADPGQRAARRSSDAKLADQIELLSIEQFARSWAATAVVADQPADVAADVYADRLRNQPAGLARALRGLGPGALPSLWERLRELQMPVALLAGQRDQKFTSIAEQMATAIPDAEMIIVPGVGHAAHLEAPERIASIITTLG